MIDKVKDIAKRNNFILDNDYYSIEELLLRKSYFFERYELYRFIEILDVKIIYTIYGKFELDFDLKKYIEDILQQDIEVLINNIYNDIKINKIQKRDFIDNHLYVLFMIDFNSIIDDIKYYDVEFINKISIILNYINSIILNTDPHFADSFTNSLIALGLGLDDDLNEYDLRILDKIKLLYGNENILFLINKLLIKEIPISEDFVFKHINSNNIGAILNNDYLFKESDFENKIINWIDNLESKFSVNEICRIYSIKLLHCLYRNDISINLYNWKNKFLTLEILNFLLEKYKLSEVLRLDIISFLDSSKELQQLILSSEFINNPNYIYVFNLKFNETLLNDKESIIKNLSYYREKRIENYIWFENLIVVNHYKIEDLNFLSLKFLDNLYNDIDFINTSGISLLNSNIEFNWNLLFKNKTFKYESSFIEDNLDYFCGLDEKILIKNLKIPIFTIIEVIEYGQTYYFNEYLYYQKLINEFDYCYREYQEQYFNYDNKILSMNKGFLTDNLVSFIEKGKVLVWDRDVYENNLYENFRNFELNSFTNDEVKFYNRLEKSYLKIKRFEYLDYNDFDYEEQTSHHIIIKCFEHLFENLSYNELDKIINFGLIDINMNILANIHIKNLILEKN